MKENLLFLNKTKSIQVLKSQINAGLMILNCKLPRKISTSKSCPEVLKENLLEIDLLDVEIDEKHTPIVVR